MDLEKLIIAGIRRAIREVFSTVLGVGLESGEVACEAAAPKPMMGWSP